RCCIGDDEAFAGSPRKRGACVAFSWGANAAGRRLGAGSAASRVCQQALGQPRALVPDASADAAPQQVVGLPRARISFGATLASAVQERHHVGGLDESAVLGGGEMQSVDDHLKPGTAVARGAVLAKITQVGAVPIIFVDLVGNHEHGLTDAAPEVVHTLQEML